MKTRDAAHALQIEEWQLLSFMIGNGWITFRSTQTSIGIVGRPDKVQAGYLVDVVKRRENRKAKELVDVTPAGLEVLRQLLPSIIRREPRP